MLVIKKILFLVFAFVFCIPSTAWLQNDILDTAFQPSQDLDQVIEIGNNKNAVGNEVFRGSTDIDGVKIDRNDVKNSRVDSTQRAPLLVRITQTLLRLTIALSIPVLIWIGVKVIKSGLSGGDVKSAIKEVSGVLMGLALALSAVGIIYLIQSIATKSLIVGKTQSSSISDTIKKDQPCIGLPGNAEWNTVSTIIQNLSMTGNIYIPTTVGIYSMTPSIDRCVFKCKNNYSYNNNLNTCVDTTNTKSNQLCTGLPANAEWNTVSSITQIWDTVDNAYLPSIVGKYSDIASTNSCVFSCKSGYIYDRNTCIRVIIKPEEGVPSNPGYNRANSIIQ